MSICSEVEKSFRKEERISLVTTFMVDLNYSIIVDPQKADELFNNLQIKDIQPRNLSLSKLEPIKSSGNSKNRVKWQDSEPNELLDYNAPIAKHLSRDNLRFEQRGLPHSSHITLRHQKERMAYPHSREVVHSDFENSNRYRSNKLSSRKQKLRKEYKDSKCFISTIISSVMC